MKTGIGAALAVVTGLAIPDPLKVTCPMCSSKAGTLCLRGSCYDATPHAERVKEAQKALGKALAALVLAVAS